VVDLLMRFFRVVGAQEVRPSLFSNPLAEGAGENAPIDGIGTISGAALTGKGGDGGAP
jgi:hypothetical protein